MESREVSAWIRARSHGRTGHEATAERLTAFFGKPPRPPVRPSRTAAGGSDDNARRDNARKANRAIRRAAGLDREEVEQ
jgi:hypothetical protein